MYEDTSEPRKMGALVGGNMPLNPLQRALDEQNEQIDKLRGLLENLSGRLQPIRNSVPREAGVEEQPTQIAGSAICSQLLSQTGQIRYLQMAVSLLLEELEV